MSLHAATEATAHALTKIMLKRRTVQELHVQKNADPATYANAKITYARAKRTVLMRATAASERFLYAY